MLYLDHIQLAMPAGQESAARYFYGELLGLTEIDKPASLASRGGIWFQLGTRHLHLGVEGSFRPAKKAHPGIGCKDVDAISRVLASAGHPVKWDESLPGRKRFYTEDPFGNRLEFIEHVDH